jgi:molybdopterin converting factor small subunit
LAVLRLFGPIADAAGTKVVEVEGANVDEVLAAAGTRYGEDFSKLAANCRVWVNGESPTAGAPLASSDEVALLPPVSGG